MANLYDEVLDAALSSDEFDGLWDEAYTRLLEDMKEAARMGETEYHWLEYQYPNVRGEVDASKLANWLAEEGFRVAYVRDSHPRQWVCIWKDKKEEMEDDDRI